MSERLSSQQRLLRTQGRFGPEQKGWQKELQLRAAVETFATFPDGFTPEDSAALAPMGRAFDQ